MDVFLSKSFFKRARKPGRGRLVNSAAMRTRPARRASAGSAASGCNSTPLTAWSSSSNRLRLAISATRLPDFFLPRYHPFRLPGLHRIKTLPQILQSPELQLLNRTFTASQVLRNFADTPLLGKPHDHHVPLVFRQFIHQPEQPCAVFHLAATWPRAQLRRILHRNLPPLPFPAIHNRIHRNPQQPRSKRHPSPLKTLQI